MKHWRFSFHHLSGRVICRPRLAAWTRPKTDRNLFTAVSIRDIVRVLFVAPIGFTALQELSWGDKLSVRIPQCQKIAYKKRSGGFDLPGYILLTTCRSATLSRSEICLS